MTNLSADWSTVRLDDAIARIVDERGTDSDWQTIVAYRDRLGNDVVMKAAQDAALKLRRSRTPTLAPTSSRRRASKRP